MKLHPRVNRSVVELVKRFEGLRRRAARLADGGWTVGYGHTRSAREGAVVSPEDAEALLYYDLSDVAEKVEAWTFTPLNQNQFEALTAFAFNIGLKNFRSSAVLKRVNEGHHLLAASALELWRKAEFEGEGLVIDGLVRRRAAEKAHYLTPPEGFRPTPTPVLKPTFDHSVIDTAANFRGATDTAVVDAPLEGDLATARVEERSQIEGSPRAPLPFPAGPIVAAATIGAATAKLHRLFPDRIDAQPAQTPPAPLAPFGEAKPASTIPVAVNDGPFGRAPDPAVAEPPPFAEGEEPKAHPSLFGAPRGHSAMAEAPAEAETSPVVQVDGPVAEPITVLRPSDLMQKRSSIYLVVGVLGVVLLGAAVFSMFRSGANSANLIIGLIGIALLAPAAGAWVQGFMSGRKGRV